MLITDYLPFAFRLTGSIISLKSGCRLSCTNDIVSSRKRISISDSRSFNADLAWLFLISNFFLTSKESENSCGSIELLFKMIDWSNAILITSQVSSSIFMLYPDFTALTTILISLGCSTDFEQCTQPLAEC
jgi:hypothetical protein